MVFGFVFSKTFANEVLTWFLVLSSVRHLQIKGLKIHGDIILGLP
jgi:hypothetical protein